MQETLKLFPRTPRNMKSNKKQKILAQFGKDGPMILWGVGMEPLLVFVVYIPTRSHVDC